MRVLRGKYKRQEEGKGTKGKRQHQKNRKPHLQGASRKPQLKDLQLKQDASTKQKKKTRHGFDLRGFSHEAAVWKVLREQTKMEKEQTQTKRNDQSKEEEATRKEAKMKEQQAHAKRSHQSKEEEATRNRFMGVLQGKYQ